MPKTKRKLTPAEKAAKARRKAEFTFIFLNGRQKMVRRSASEQDEFILRNADPLWLHQNEMWEYIPEVIDESVGASEWTDDQHIPF